MDETHAQWDPTRRAWLPHIDWTEDPTEDEMHISQIYARPPAGLARQLGNDALNRLLLQDIAYIGIPRGQEPKYRKLTVKELRDPSPFSRIVGWLVEVKNMTTGYEEHGWLYSSNDGIVTIRLSTGAMSDFYLRNSKWYRNAQPYKISIIHRPRQR
jgi:hypothetical protein